MSDLISRSALKAAFEEDGHLSAYIEEYINDAPAVDAVPVVRCRDCQEIEPCVAVNDGYSWCNAWGTVVSLDGFCHKGAKVDAKEDEKCG